jgi:ketosteroid isomerase-like protein
MKNFVAVMAMVLVCAAAAFGECSSADKAALEAFDRAWGDAGLNGNRDALMAVYADDYVGLPGGLSKQATIDNTMTAFAARKADPTSADKTSHEHYRISCTANSALITHRNTVWVPDGPGGKAATFFTRSVHTLEKRGGKWQVVGNSGNGMNDYDALWYLEQDWNDAVWRKNKDWFEKNYAPDFSGVNSRTGAVYSRAEDIADTMNDKNVYDLVETTDMNIRIDGNAALITGIFHLRGKDDKGAATDRRIRYTDTWVKRDGRWVAWSSHGTNIAAK